MSMDISINIFVEHGRENAAAEFYQTAFGFVEVSRGEIDGSLSSVAMRAGEVEFIVVGANPNREKDPSRGGPFFIKEPGNTSVLFTLKVADINDAYEKAVSRGAAPRSSLEATEDGRLAGTLIDPFGHIWAFLEKRADLSEAA